MQSINVYIVVSLDSGWDNIVCVYDASKITLEEVQEEYSGEDGYIVFEHQVHNKL